MTLHQSHNVSPNSVNAYYTEKPKLNGRRKLIFECIKKLQPVTDRQIMRHLGFTDPNTTRPRVTELIKLGYLVEVSNTKDKTTNKTVRQVAVKPDKPEQLRLV
jgi:predicted HTH transcriptional regulator